MKNVYFFKLFRMVSISKLFGDIDFMLTGNKGGHAGGVVTWPQDIVQISTNRKSIVYIPLNQIPKKKHKLGQVPDC